MITEPNFIIFELFSVIPALWLPNRIVSGSATGLGKTCEHRITESLTEWFWEFYSVIWVEEVPNRNHFGINSVIFFVCNGVVFWGLQTRVPARGVGGHEQ